MLNSSVSAQALTNPRTPRTPATRQERKTDPTKRCRPRLPFSSVETSR